MALVAAIAVVTCSVAGAAGIAGIAGATGVVIGCAARLVVDVMVVGAVMVAVIRTH